MVKTRTANIKDEDKVIDLYMQLGSGQLSTNADSKKRKKVRPIFREVINDENKGAILIAEREDDIIGMIALSYPTSMRTYGIYSCIEGFIVSEKARGEGVGSKLLEAAIATSQSRGCYDIEVGNPSETGYPLYLRYGLEDTGKHLIKRLSNSV